MKDTCVFDNEKNKIEPGTLYLVGTPIGNAADIGGRAVKTLAEVSFVAAEDTRNSGRLISNLGIKQNYVSYHEHNKAEAGPKIVERLKNGESCALVTDAGMPGVSDPGQDLVALCVECGVKVTCVPGPCAFVTALVLSGLDTRSFCFEGFLAGSNGEKRKKLEDLVSLTQTLIFYEAPHRLKETLGLLFDVLGDRRAALCRELTKLNEEVVRGTLSEFAEKYAETDPRGEFVIVVEGKTTNDASEWSDLTVEEHIASYVKSEGLSTMEAVKRVAKDRGMKKSEVYKYTLK